MRRARLDLAGMKVESDRMCTVGAGGPRRDETRLAGTKGGERRSRRQAKRNRSRKKRWHPCIYRTDTFSPRSSHELGLK
jgi:hypothetical protein